MKLPSAKKANIVVQEAGEELLVYNITTNRAYYLNMTARIVFNACGHESSHEELKDKYNYTDDLIYLTLSELKKNDLIEDEVGNHYPAMTRREAAKRVGLATLIALPVISSLVAPTTAQAQSVRTLANGQSCSGNNQCTSGICGRGNCCSADTFGLCDTSADCCSGVACTSGVCCQGIERVCDTRAPNECCTGLFCVAPAGETNGSCQPAG